MNLNKLRQFKKSHFVRGGFFVLALSFFFGVSFLATAEEIKPPNIIVILADDMGWKDLSYIDDSFYETPNIDALANNGAFFSQAYSPAPSCVPSRASLLTGQSTARLKTYMVATTTGEADRRRQFEQLTNRFFGPIQDVKSLGNYFSEAGYQAAYLGKWNVGIHDRPKDHGYQEQFAASHVGMPQSYFSPWGINEVKADKTGEYLTDALTDKATEFIKRPKEAPFLLVLSYYAPHVPWQAKQEKIDHFRKKDNLFSSHNPVYAAMIAAVDDGVGKVIEALRQSEQLENTIIVFASDNGPERLTGSVYPYTGYKNTATEGGLKIPLIFYSPKYVPASIQNKPVSLTALVPTLLSMAGIVAPDKAFDSQSFADLLRQDNKNNELGDDFLFWHFPVYSPGVSEKSIWFSLTPVSIIRHGDWKLIEDYEDGGFKLFNTKNDPAEKTNLLKVYPEKARQLQEQLRLKQQQTQAILPKAITPMYQSDNAIKKVAVYAKQVLFVTLVSYSASIYMVVLKSGITWWVLLLLIFIASGIIALIVGFLGDKYYRLIH